jgi:hypothetical protein
VNQAEHVIESVRAAGGTLALHGRRIRCRLPQSATHLLDELRTCRNEVEKLLRQHDTVPAMPPGVQLVEWLLKSPPVAIETFAVVTDPALFAVTTLEQLRRALSNSKSWVGWSVPQLIERLAQVGVTVKLAAEENNLACGTER